MTVDLDIRQHRATVTLRRPDVLNAMNLDVFDELADVADQIAARDAVRVVLVRGEGRAFSSGIDTSALGTGALPIEQMIERAQSGFRKFAALPMPTVASVHGYALGAGLQLALACDIRIVTASAQLGLLEAKYGIIPDLGGTQRLTELVGPGRAKKMIWLAEKIDGTEAHRIGLAELLCSPDKLDAASEKLVAALEVAPPIAVRHAKRLIDLAPRVDHAQSMDEEAKSQLQTMNSSDFTEALTAFIERRPPKYAGK
jgi:enoyl-CoA hydratase/carnithine racemase